MDATSQSILYVSESIVKESTAPVIVVGLPRSGSSYLAHVLSCLDGWLVFDDLYPYQKAKSIGIDRSINLAGNEKLLKKYINELTWQLRAKLRWEQSFFLPGELTWEDTEKFEIHVFEALAKRESLFWPDVLEEWMTRLAIYSGKSRWGYKTPQDFMHMDELAELFPGAKFIYILRDPRKVMQSFKSLPRVKTQGSQDGTSRQYHPVVYALYWANAYNAVEAFKAKGKAPVETVKFEELVKTPRVVADRLARFLGTTVCGDVEVSEGNSSSKQGVKRELTGLEVQICERLAGSCMKEFGYEFSDQNLRLFDIFDFIDTSFTFMAYQIERIIKSKRGRSSVLAFLRSVRGGRV